MANLKKSYRHLPSGNWEGVLKDAAGKLVWACGHSHACRDYNHSKYYAAAGAAMSCARDELERRMKCEAA